MERGRQENVVKAVDGETMKVTLDGSYANSWSMWRVRIDIIGVVR